MKYLYKAIGLKQIVENVVIDYSIMKEHHFSESYYILTRNNFLTRNTIYIY